MRARYVIILLCAAAMPISVAAQEAPSRLRHEVGIWIGASNPVPGTRLDEVLDANIGAGGFYRVNWPWVFFTESGVMWSQYFSRTTQKVTVVPVYLALDYRLPIDFKLQTFVKLGGGGAWLEVRPANRSGWEPLLYAGLEFSIPASRRLPLPHRRSSAQPAEHRERQPPQDQNPALPGRASRLQPPQSRAAPLRGSWSSTLPECPVSRCARCRRLLPL